MCVETEFGSSKAHLIKLIVRLIQHELACGWQRGPPPTSTKSKHPSSQTEEVCVEMEFGSYKALVVFELI
eukprot:scaffold17015_cov195-Skeletonema_marinoi.AAC.1